MESLLQREPTYVNSPHGRVALKLGNLNLQGGIKYFSFKDSDSLGYVTNATTLSLQRAPDLDRKGKPMISGFPPWEYPTL